LATGAKIAIILAVSAIVLVILAVVFFVVFFANVITAPADVANDYVRALDAGELNTAWNHISTATQQQETRQKWEKKVGVFKDKITKWNTTSINITNDVARIVMSITFIDNVKATWNMVLVKENGEWKVRQVTSSG
jgi:predicted PurR-regulated permease PerM